MQFPRLRGVPEWRRRLQHLLECGDGATISVSDPLPAATSRALVIAREERRGLSLSGTWMSPNRFPCKRLALKPVHGTVPDGQYINNFVRFINVKNDAVDVRFLAIEQVTQGEPVFITFRSKRAT